MARQRITQRFPFLLPVRQWERKKMFYLQMKLDQNIYSSSKESLILPYKIYETQSNMINENSGQDIQYQYNKVDNLKLLSNTINQIVIRPLETFSFWHLAKNASNYGEYKDGLVLKDGKIVAEKAGGLCQMSNVLFWAFLHTPLTIIERHPHLIEDFPSPDKDIPVGVDATINEGWQDLKVKNNTNQTFKIKISFDDRYLVIAIYADTPSDKEYSIYNKNISYQKIDNAVYQTAEVWRKEINIYTKEEKDFLLYTNKCEIGYPLDPLIQVSGD